MGFATKRIYVIPSLDIVAVRLGEGDDLNWDDDSFLKPIVDAANGGSSAGVGLLVRCAYTPLRLDDLEKRLLYSS